MKKKILIPLLTVSFVFALLLPIQLPTNDNVISSYFLQHGA